MFLIERAFLHSSRVQLKASLRLLGFVLLACVARGEQPSEPCVLDVPVYGPTGSKLAFKITRVTGEGNPSVNLLSVHGDGIKFSAAGDRLLFPKALLGRSIVITLEDKDTKGGIVTRKLPLFACRQRTSSRWGINQALGDFSSLTIRGRLSGCTFSGDWWIRAMPMFGAQDYQAVYDGFVQSDGSFWLTGSMSGERQLVVIGKGREPVKTVGIDVAEGKPIDMGVVDLSGYCPK
jgi:hypothetical protein